MRTRAALLLLSALLLASCGNGTRAWYLESPSGAVACVAGDGKFLQVDITPEELASLRAEKPGLEGGAAFEFLFGAPAESWASLTEEETELRQAFIGAVDGALGEGAVKERVDEVFSSDFVGTLSSITGDFDEESLAKAMASSEQFGPYDLASITVGAEGWDETASWLRIWTETALRGDAPAAD